MKMYLSKFEHAVVCDINIPVDNLSFERNIKRKTEKASLTKYKKIRQKRKDTKKKRKKKPPKKKKIRNQKKKREYRKKNGWMMNLKV